MVVTAILMLGLAYWYLASGLLVPHPWLAILWAVWVGLALAAWGLRRRPLMTLLVPLFGALFWLVYVQGLGTLLNWQP
jgi:hypothetical protein